MAKTIAAAHIISFNDRGESTAPTVRVNARLCRAEDPQIFDIELPDSRVTRFRSVRITRAELERVLAANPVRRKRKGQSHG